MHTIRKLHVLSALVSSAAMFVLSIPSSAQSTVTVEGNLRVQNGNSDCTSAYFKKSKGAEKIYGYSQSALLAILYKYCGQGAPVDPAGDLEFVLVEDPMRPDGGLFARFPTPSLPTLDFGAVPNASTRFDFYQGNIPIYTIEYDGFADFPRYPLNAISDDNKLLGFTFTVNFKDIGVPKSAKITRVHVKFSQKKPGGLAIGDAGLLIPGKTVISKNKVILSESK